MIAEKCIHEEINSGMSKDLPLLSSLQWNKTYVDELWNSENVRISHRISFFINIGGQQMNIAFSTDGPTHLSQTFVWMECCSSHSSLFILSGISNPQQ